MIVSLHITHVSAGGTEGLDNVIPLVEKNVAERIGTLESVTEYVTLSTCNRYEVYVATEDNGRTSEILEDIVRQSVPYTPDKKFSFILTDRDSIRHLFRVACGLDSLIVGEDQIQHQVRESYMRAKAEGHANGYLSYLFDRTLAVGKRVRSETDLNRGAVSVGSAAVELAELEIGGLEGKTVTILGAGDMASVIARSLVGKGPNAVFVSNRTFEHAKELAGQLGGTAISMDRMTDAIHRSDLVLVATSAPHYVVRKEDAEPAMTGRQRPLLMIDVSVPRNISPDCYEVPGVDVHTMDSLQSIAMENVSRRTREISRAEKIITQELTRMDREGKERMADDVIRMMCLKLSRIREQELCAAKSRAENCPDMNCVLDDFSRALVSKITAEPFNRLRAASRQGRMDICNAATDLFGLEDERR